MMKRSSVITAVCILLALFAFLQCDGQSGLTESQKSCLERCKKTITVKTINQEWYRQYWKCWVKCGIV